MSLAVSKFLDTLMVHFPFKHESDEREVAWVTSMVRELRGFSANVLDKAAEDIIRNRTDRRFPLPADCRKACIEAQKWADVEARRGSLQIEGAPGSDPVRWGEFTGERFKLADDLLRTAEGRQAAKEGYAGTWHAFVRKHSRVPTPSEAAICKREAKEFDAAYAQCVKGGWPQAALLESLGAAMLEKRKELERKALK